jgi:hypothetical protein
VLESGLTDVFATQHMTYAAQHLFTDTNQARGFVMMRHPVKRVIDQFLYRQHTATHEKEWQLIDSVSLEDFVVSDQLMENFEVRMLNGITDFTTPITEAHVEMAKEILRRKFVVGIFEWFDVGMVRFEKYFGWWERYDVLNNLTINNCHYSVIESGDDVGGYPHIANADKVYSNIMTRSWADVELYHYAKVSTCALKNIALQPFLTFFLQFLFAEQAKLI